MEINEQLKNPDHPFWRWGMHATYLGAALAGLWLFSSTFDETELKTLATIIAAVLATGGAKQWLTRQQAEKTDG